MASRHWQQRDKHGLTQEKISRRLDRAPVSSLSLIHLVIPASSSLLAFRSSAGGKDGGIGGGWVGSLPVAQSSPTMGFSCLHLCLEWGTGGDISAGVQAEGPRGDLAELRAPGESRKVAGQAISPEHNVLAEVSTHSWRSGCSHFLWQRAASQQRCPGEGLRPLKGRWC